MSSFTSTKAFCIQCLKSHWVVIVAALPNRYCLGPMSCADISRSNWVNNEPYGCVSSISRTPVNINEESECPVRYIMLFIAPVLVHGIIFEPHWSFIHSVYLLKITWNIVHGPFVDSTAYVCLYSIVYFNIQLLLIWSLNVSV